jgi:nucleotide-binding universal stress UspA family protein
MFQHLLVATDRSQDGEEALRQGLGLAKALSAKVTVATVTEPWTEAAYATLPTPSLDQVYEKAAAAILHRAKKAADQAGIECVTRHIKDQHAPQGIIRRQRMTNVISSSSGHTDGAVWVASCSAASHRKCSHLATEPFLSVAELLRGRIPHRISTTLGSAAT